MARKRGGIAGFYDRNKKVLQYVAPALAGAFTGGTGGAIVGGLMRGLDRPGKSGIGLDVGQAARGALEGYGMGKLGQRARAGIGKMLAPKMPNVDVAGINRATDLAMGGTPSLPDVVGGDLGLGRSAMLPMTSGASVTPSVSAAPAASGGYAGPSFGADRLSSVSLPKEPLPSISSGGSKTGKVTQAMDFLNKYEKPLGGIAKGFQAVLPNAAVEAQQESNALQRERQAFEQQQIEEERKRQRNMALMLVPLLNRQMGMPGSAGESVPSSFIYGGGPASMQDAIDLSGATTSGYMAPATMGRGTAMGNYLEQQGLTDTTPAGVRYAQSYGRRPQPPASMLRRGAGGYSIYDR